MADSVARARKLLDRWRTQHAGQPLPIQLHIIDALATRASQHDGQTRQLLNARLAILLDAQPGSTSPGPTKANQRDKSARKNSKNAPRAGLSDLLQHLSEHKLDTPKITSEAPATNAFPAMPVLDEFRKTWSTVRTRSQLRQSLSKSPENAGPLNSSVLVNRAIHLMRDTSPQYLQHFITYVDTLSWMEQMQNDGILASQDAPRTSLAKKPTRKVRKR